MTVGELAAVSEAALVRLLGRAAGRKVHALSHNRDPRPVELRRRRRSIGSQCALGRSRRSATEVDATLLAIVDRVTRRMRTARRIGRTVVLRLRFDDFSRATRSHTLPFATAHTETILGTARSLLAASAPLIRDRGLTLVGVAVTNLDDDIPFQLTLPFDRRSSTALDAAVDEVRERFGLNALTRAVLLGRDQSLTMPLLPD
jgi:DNA polymerase-4